MIDPVRLTADLVRCPSVTPEEGGALVLLDGLLTQAGFETFRADRGEVSNLVARSGPKGAARTFGFNGHTDVVPVGDRADWAHDPFGAEERDGYLYGRGATDMKSGVAAFVAAAIDFAPDMPTDGAIVLTVTGDEEGESTDGTTAILDWMAENGEAMDVCLVGEPTCPDALGDMIKIGRRGSLNARFEARGVQGHSAYPHRAKNPVAALARLIAEVSSETLDEGTEHFDPSTLAVTTFDTGNPATNVIPASCRAGLNIRFNDAHTSQSLLAWLRSRAEAVSAETGVDITLTSRVSGESFITPPGPLSELVSRAVEAETGRTPVLSTTGGTSDARFVKDHCPVVEFGLTGKTMHEVDERVAIDEIRALKAVYTRVLKDYFA